MRKHRITVIGAAIMDVLAVPIDFSNIHIGSQPMEDITMSYGGDALNEAIIMKKLGMEVELISKLGPDQAGNQIIKYIESEGILTEGIKRDSNTPTSINVVLVDDKGERYFLTNPNGSMRKLAEEDIEAYLDTGTDIVSFAGMFVSPLLDIAAMERVFSKIKKRPERILAVDMTKAKNGETLKDIEPLLKYVDFIFPNESEIIMLTGETDKYKNAKLLVEAGAKCAVIKCGKDGCLIYAGNEFIELPAYPVQKLIDSTGAGDAFVAGFLTGLQLGFTLEECGRFANAAASCIVEELGATRGITSLEKPFERYKKMI